ncbi:hypothetical protein RchiOBHm_Chr5g0045451 [Rosa chinensis]|uniref:Uncharacterized protein n=1 Tax=Rosa chinensis TaxID=74649 RepID=A0A2P6QDT8_ROSCH|nr:hypothetical protein RchiOBHm_Chr5g0045451 [Rosa chinensis]
MSYQLLHRLHQREQYPSGLKNFTNTLFLCLGFDGKQIGFCKLKENLPIKQNGVAHFD